MGHAYRAVQWNRQKRRYDLAIAVGVGLYLGAFMACTAALDPEATAETTLIRALGTCALVMLHVVLSIGPLARLDRRWLPLLYNRRHLGVSMALVASLHGALSLVQFHGFGDENPFVSLLSAEGGVAAFSDLPFQPLGAGALAILLLMAATSHDFWLANLTAPVWKSLHMLVYVAYALLVLHVALGSIQADTSIVAPSLLGIGAIGLGTLHTVAARRGHDEDRTGALAAGSEDWLDACAVDDVPDGRAKIVLAGGERVAIFRDGERLSALSGVCQHQNGPLGEGRIVDGLVVCPWHGYQYRPSCGCSPEPFHETVPTFRLRTRGDRIELDPRPLPLGTVTEPLVAPRTEDR